MWVNRPLEVSQPDQLSLSSSRMSLLGLMNICFFFHVSLLRCSEVFALNTYGIYLVFCSVIFIHKLDIIRNVYLIWLKIFISYTITNIIKIRQHLTE